MSTAAVSRPTQPIAGVAPAEWRETTIMTVWPSVARYGLGQLLGKAFAIRWPDVYIFRLGNLIALLSIPVALALYFVRILPFVGVRYTVTNRRIIVQRGITGTLEKAIDFDRFSTVDIEFQPGQEWYDAGDLVFRQGNVETFRLEGVSRPVAFREVCVKAHMAYMGVKKVRSRA
jgi:hypothetical protein